MMKTLRRIGATVIASFDSVVSQIENHEALVNSAIREVQESASRAKVQLNKVRQDGHNMRKRLLEFREQADTWQERAVQTSKEDKQKALECLKRKKLLEKKTTELETQEREHARLEKQLSADLGVMEEKITGLKQQRNIMRTRQSRADTIRLLQSDDSSLVSEIDEIFERWETKVGQYENYSEISSQLTDQLAEEYLLQEEEKQLSDELEALLKASE